MQSLKQSLGKLIFASLATSLCFVSAAVAQDPQSEERPQPPKIIRKSGGVLQGSATKRAEPVYPPLAKAARISGSVVVDVTIDEEGNVISARAVSGHPLLKDAAVAAAKGWTFSPTQLQGTPVKVIGTITFNFVLGHSKEIEALRKELETNPNSAELYYRLGVLHLEDENYEDAIKALTYAIGLDPRLAKSYVALGDAYLRDPLLDGRASAIDAYTRAVSLDPGSAEGYCGLGLALWNEHLLAEAIEAYRAAVRISPDTERAHDALGNLYEDSNRYDLALEEFKKVLELRPDNAGAHRSIGRMYLHLGDKDSALREYNILKRIDKFQAELFLDEINGHKQY